MSLLREIEHYEVFFETPEIGDKFVTAGRTVTEADVVAFAGLSGDFNSLHTDAEYAQGTLHKQRLAHGMLVLSIMSGLCTRLPVMKCMERTILGLANLECRWKRPTFIGDTLHIVLEIIDKKPSHKPDRGTIVMRRTAVNQRDETVLESDWSLVIRRQNKAQT